MAERRMFTKKVTDDDHFQTLSSSAQALYLHLMMSADDDGFSNQVMVSMFKAHASTQDLEALLSARYIYQFESGVIVIKHWRMANALRKDRYTPTAFKEEFAQLHVKDNGAYTLENEGEEAWLPFGCQMVATGKDRSGKDSIGECLEEGPTQEEVSAYCDERHNGVDAKRFYNYYSARGWTVNGDPVRDWKALLRTWEPKDLADPNTKQKRLDELKAQREEAVKNGASKEELETIDLNIISVEDSIRRSA